MRLHSQQVLSRRKLLLKEKHSDMSVAKDKNSTLKAEEIPFSAFLLEYTAYLSVERGMSAHTVAAYKRNLTQYLLFMHDDRALQSLQEITKDDVLAYIAHLRTEGYAATSVDQKIASVKGFHKFLLSENLCSVHPADSLPRFKHPSRLPDIISVERIDALIEQFDERHDPASLRDRAILEVLYGCGLRVSELCNLELMDVLFEEGVLRVFGKGSKERIAPLGSSAARALKDYLARGRDKLHPKKKLAPVSSKVFLSSRGNPLAREIVFRMVKSAGESVGIENLHPHTLRHSYATHMLEGGADLRSLQELLGHSDLSTTQIYTHVDQSYMREEYLLKHPRARKR